MHTRPLDMPVGRRFVTTFSSLTPPWEESGCLCEYPETQCTWAFGEADLRARSHTPTKIPPGAWRGIWPIIWNRPQARGSHGHQRHHIPFLWDVILATRVSPLSPPWEESGCLCDFQWDIVLVIMDSPLSPPWEESGCLYQRPDRDCTWCAEGSLAQHQEQPPSQGPSWPPCTSQTLSDPVPPPKSHLAHRRTFGPLSGKKPQARGPHGHAAHQKTSLWDVILMTRVSPLSPPWEENGCLYPVLQPRTHLGHRGEFGPSSGTSLMPVAPMAMPHITKPLWGTSPW